MALDFSSDPTFVRDTNEPGINERTFAVFEAGSLRAEKSPPPVELPDGSWRVEYRFTLLPAAPQ